MTQREKIATWPTSRANRAAFRLPENLSGNRTITTDEIEAWQGLVFDPGGAHRDVTLPAVAACQGVYAYISNTANAAENLVVKAVGGATVCTIGQEKSALVWSDGVRWYSMVGA